MRAILAALLAVLVSASAFADELAVQRKAVKAKLAGAAPAVPTGVDVPGDGAIFIENGRVVRYDCKRTKDFLTREQCWNLGGGLSADSSAAPATK